MKSLNPKVESVQIAWEETRWEEIGNGTPQGEGNVIRVFGGFNHIKRFKLECFGLHKIWKEQ